MGAIQTAVRSQSLPCSLGELYSVGGEYETLNKQIIQRLLAHLFKQLPHLEDHIDHYELSSPLTIKNFVNYQKGEFYGIDYLSSHYMHKFLPPHMLIMDLFLTSKIL